MTNTAKSSKYWITSSDEASAYEAVKMAGLSVILLALNAAFICFALLLIPDSAKWIIYTNAALTILFLIFAFRLKAGHAASLPVLAILFVLFAGATSAYNVVTLIEALGTGYGILKFLSMNVVLILAGYLLVCGLYGWNWLRKNNVKMTY